MYSAAIGSSGDEGWTGEAEYETREREMHLIVDEIYALSVFNTAMKFTSVVKLLDNQLDMHVHVLW